MANMGIQRGRMAALSGWDGIVWDLTRLHNEQTLEDPSLFQLQLNFNLGGASIILLLIIWCIFSRQDPFTDFLDDLPVFAWISKSPEASPP